MIRTKNNILIVDTETVGTFGSPIIHDIGYKIIDKDFNTLLERRFLVKELHEVNQYMLFVSDFYQSKKHLYDEVKETNSIDIVAWKDIEKIFINDMRSYKVKVISAYNMAFDYKAFNATSHFFNLGSTKLMDAIDKKSLLCIYNLACDTILDTDDYRDYATMKNFISDKGNYLTNAECCYRYLIDDETFEEEHTALADVEIEKQILEHIIKNCKHKVQYGLAYNCWRKVQRGSGTTTTTPTPTPIATTDEDEEMEENAE
jgi:DNA polymerase III epsilon subunit-like protein